MDFIDFFLNAESDSVEKEITGVYDKSNVQVTKRLTFDEVIGQLNLFLIAGFDTTANTLSFTMFYLAKFPKIQERLRKEIEDNCFSQVNNKIFCVIFACLGSFVRGFEQVEVCRSNHERSSTSPPDRSTRP
jgi:cytochrome P450